MRGLVRTHWLQKPLVGLILGVLCDDLRAEAIAAGAHIVTIGPEFASPQIFLHLGERGEGLAR
jgi:hypothetical protein